MLNRTVQKVHRIDGLTRWMAFHITANILQQRPIGSLYESTGAGLRFAENALQIQAMIPYFIFPPFITINIRTSLFSMSRISLVKYREQPFPIYQLFSFVLLLSLLICAIG